MHCSLLTLVLLCTITLSALELTPQEADTIGTQIFFNECGQKKEKLVWWNQGEEFASLGVGHFIWYPQNKRGPFEETFPLLIAFFKEKKISLPPWVDPSQGCPWLSLEDFFKPQHAKKQKELQELLFNTLSLQTDFIYQRFQTILQQIIQSLDPEKKPPILYNLQQLQASPNGKFALIDYLNFKGSGLSSQENYNGAYWGLKQVLETMPPSSTNPLHSFIETSKKLLIQRVKKAPSERHEERWLPGWIARVERYQHN